MKKLIAASLLLLLLAIPVLANDIPAPFSKIKEIALRGPSIGGIHETKITINEDGREIEYLFGYATPQNAYGVHESVGIAKAIGTEIEVYGYCLLHKEFYGAYGQQRFTEKEATEGAFKLFRELVSKNLL